MGSLLSAFPLLVPDIFGITIIIIIINIALGDGPDDREVRVPARDENFTLQHRFQIDSIAHPASYLMGTRGSFPGGEAAGV